MDKRVLLAAPRGFRAGVDRAVRVVEQTLARYGRRCTYVTRSCTTPT